MPAPRDTHTTSNARPVRAIPRPVDMPDIYESGRTCCDCGHTLSIYNEGPDCNACALTKITQLRPQSPRAELLELMRQAA